MLAARLGSSALRRTSAARGIHATASAGMYFKRMELEVWFDKWQYVARCSALACCSAARCSVLRRCSARRYHCNVDIGESAVKWKTIKELGIDMEKIELRYGHHTGASPPPRPGPASSRCTCNTPLT